MADSTSPGPVAPAPAPGGFDALVRLLMQLHQRITPDDKPALWQEGGDAAKPHMPWPPLTGTARGQQPELP